MIRNIIRRAIAAYLSALTCKTPGCTLQTKCWECFKGEAL